MQAAALKALRFDRFLLRLLGGLRPAAASQPTRDLAIARAFFIHFRDRPAARMPLLADEYPVVGGRRRLVRLGSQPGRTRALRKSIRFHLVEVVDRSTHFTLPHAVLSLKLQGSSRQNYELGGTRLCLTCSRAVTGYGWAARLPCAASTNAVVHNQRLYYAMQT